MNLKLVRTTKTPDSTIGELYINDTFECFILEDTDRGLNQSMATEEIKEKKVYAKTAIPSGKYEIAITFSNRFQKYLPLVINVKGYEGIRIHPGNTSSDTEGCLLPGTSRTINKVLESKKAFNSLFNKLKAVEKKEKITIEISSP
jgi:hypothetical protein